MNKKALIVGINYPGTSHELRGCVNDANLIKKTIINEFGFSNIKMILDNDATTANMLDGLNWLVDGAQPGDVLYFHYSGHGSQMLDYHGEEMDGLDEIICPVDLDWNTKVIRDDDLKRIFEKVPNGVNLTVTLDCCNSGGGLDQANQYQSLGLAKEMITEDPMKAGGRFLPPPDLTEDQTLQVEEYMGFKPRALQRNVDASGMLISGCQAHQTSADAYIDGDYIGACTYYLVKTLRDANYAAPYKSIVDSMNAQLAAAGYTQRPELNGPEVLFDKQFLQQYVEVTDEGVTEIVMDNSNLEVTEAGILVDSTPEKEEKSNTKWIIIALAAAAALALLLS